jgi:hypothetical protein
MRCDSFVRSALFAAVAALGWLPWEMIASPLLGAWNARALYLLATTAWYVAGLSPRGTRRMAVALAAGLIGAGVALAARTTAELAIACGAILAVARSGFLYRTAPARALGAEIALLLGGLLFARFLAGSPPTSVAPAIWGFLLVQSLFFLLPGVRSRPVVGRHADPFEEAHRRALALLERPGVY